MVGGERRRESERGTDERRERNSFRLQNLNELICHSVLLSLPF